MYLKLLLGVLLLTFAVPTFSQVVPESEQGGVPLTIGVGFSDYATDWTGRMVGPMIWADYNFYAVPFYLQGFGIEAEGRDLHYDVPSGDPNLRQDTGLVGPIYTMRHYRKIHPYAKFLMGLGSIDFTSSDPNYRHDTRTVFAPGGGVEYRVYRHVWVRGDYEYQFWTNFFNHHALNPNGITIGVAYDLKRISSSVTDFEIPRIPALQGTRGGIVSNPRAINNGKN